MNLISLYKERSVIRSITIDPRRYLIPVDLEQKISFAYKSGDAKDLAFEFSRVILMIGKID